MTSRQRPSSNGKLLPRQHGPMFPQSARAASLGNSDATTSGCPDVVFPPQPAGALATTTRDPTARARRKPRATFVKPSPASPVVTHDEDSGRSNDALVHICVRG